MRIELSGGVAVDMFKALDIARGRDAMRVALTGINWEIAGGVHTFTTTDSYRLHTVTVPDTGATYEDSVILSGDIVKAVQVAAKAAGKGGNVVLERFDGSVNVSGVNDIGAAISRVTVDILNNEFPTCRSIIDGATDIELPALFNGKYLAGLIDAATLWAGKDRPVTVESIHATKPGRVTAANDYGVFTGVIMPQRAGK
jgi:DNA polymerase III sliding clamp (beta) subunit (PCNA family)